MNNHKVINVFLEDRKVGTLAAAKNHVIAFQYDDKWLDTGFSISPLSLPLEKKSQRVCVIVNEDLGKYLKI